MRQSSRAWAAGVRSARPGWGSSAGLCRALQVMSLRAACNGECGAALASRAAR